MGDVNEFFARGKDRGETPYIYARPLNIDEAARWAGLTKQTLYTYARQGRLGYKVNKAWFFPQPQLAEFFLGKYAAASRNFPDLL